MVGIALNLLLDVGEDVAHRENLARMGGFRIVIDGVEMAEFASESVEAFVKLAIENQSRAGGHIAENEEEVFGVFGNATEILFPDAAKVDVVVDINVDGEISGEEIRQIHFFRVFDFRSVNVVIRFFVDLAWRRDANRKKGQSLDQRIGQKLFDLGYDFLKDFLGDDDHILDDAADDDVVGNIGEAKRNIAAGKVNRADDAFVFVELD